MRSDAAAENGTARRCVGENHDAECPRCFDPLFGTKVQPESDRYLYHYTPLRTLESVREHMTLRLNPLAWMHDPYESQPVVPQFHLDVTPPEPSHLSEEENAAWLGRDWPKVINEARQRAKIFSVAMDAAPDLSLIENDEPLRRALTPQATFQARGFARPRMWDQYADHHAGACLVFERRYLQRAIEKTVGTEFHWGCGPIEYARPEYGPSLGSFEIRQLLEDRLPEAIIENYKLCFLEKHADWKDEAEFRYFVLDGTATPLHVEVDAPCIAGLVVGAKFDATKDLDCVGAFAEAFEIAHAVRLAIWARGSCDLLPVRLDRPYA